ASVRDAAQNSVVLLKGPTTLVSDPHGDLIFVRNANQRLATAGTGDVLTGIIGALIRNTPPHLAAAAAAHWHGQAAQLAQPGMTASDLPSLLQSARSAMFPT
ncbi:MAG: NAD(P)H-hydrate dehydratase, partial [Actinomycetota bacterium]|nr:NAD(P)H-hydrate dehydratase [Actinomycetota bacterium]